jgi:8-oxo-dGTP pyrophosphatase MutT (NUDIX family)
MPAERIGLAQAKEDKLFYVVANVVVWRSSDGRCLVLRRSKDEKVHPGKWCVPGGKLEWADLDVKHPTRLNGEVLDFEDAVEKLLVREVREEAGIEIDPSLSYVNSVAYVRADGVPTLLIKFAARYKGGEVRTERGSFDGHAWVNAEEVKKLDCILGIPGEVAKTIGIFELWHRFFRRARQRRDLREEKPAGRNADWLPKK